jgi:hypothetical protein
MRERPGICIRRAALMRLSLVELASMSIERVDRLLLLLLLLLLAVRRVACAARALSWLRGTQWSPRRWNERLTEAMADRRARSPAPYVWIAESSALA